MYDTLRWFHQLEVWLHRLVVVPLCRDGRSTRAQARVRESQMKLTFANSSLIQTSASRSLDHRARKTEPETDQGTL